MEAGQGSRAAVLSGAFNDALLKEPMLLHPALAEVAHGNPQSSSFRVEPLKRGNTRTRDEVVNKTHAFLPCDQRGVSPPEQCGAPAGDHHLPMRVPDGCPELCGFNKERRLHVYRAHCMGRRTQHLRASRLEPGHCGFQSIARSTCSTYLAAANYAGIPFTRPRDKTFLGRVDVPGMQGLSISLSWHCCHGDLTVGGFGYLLTPNIRTCVFILCILGSSSSSRLCRRLQSQGHQT